MAESRFNKERDHRFNDWRRNSVLKLGQVVKLPIYMIDIDGVEYGYKKRKHPYEDKMVSYPVAIAILEYKGSASWRKYWKDQLTVQIDIAAKLEIPFFVVEHNETFSNISIYHVTKHPVWERKPSNVDLFTLRNGRKSGGVADLIAFLCYLHRTPLPQSIYDDWVLHINGIELCEDGSVKEVLLADSLCD